MKKKLKRIFENSVWWSGVIMVGLVLGVSLQFVKAWTEPATAPPGGNVGAPVNTSLLDQTKAGGLRVLTLLTHGFQMPDGAKPGAVLIAQADPLNPAVSNGTAAWGAVGGGGICFVNYCADPKNSYGGANDGGILCADSGGKNCPAGSSEKIYLGKWGACVASWSGQSLAYFSPPGGGCFSSAGWGFDSVGKAYVCCKD